MERLRACDHSHLLHQLTQILQQIGNLGHSLETVSIIFQDFYFLVLFYHTEFMGKREFQTTAVLFSCYYYVSADHVNNLLFANISVCTL